MAVGAVIGAAGGILKIFGGLFGGAHKKNAARENGLLVNLVPQVEAKIAEIEQRVGAGQMTVEEATQTLDRIVPEFKQAVLAGGVKYEDTGGKCNAGCVYGNQFAQKVSALRLRLKQIAPIVAKPGAVAGAVGFFKTGPGLALLWAVPGVGVLALGSLVIRAFRRG